MGFRRIAVLGVVLSACAAEKPFQPLVVGGPAEPAAASRPGPVRAPTPAEMAATFRNPMECASEATRLHDEDREKGFALFEACVSRENFTEVSLILKQPWIGELARRGDEGARIAARVIAARGGDFTKELSRLQTQNIALYALAGAIKDPKAHRGKLVLARARLEGEKLDKKKGMMLALAETTLTADNQEEWFTYGRAWEQRAKGGTTGTSMRTGKYGNKIVVGSKNVAVETGAQVRARVTGPKPPMEVGKEYFVLLRFESSKMEGEDEIPTASAVLLDAHAPGIGVSF